MFDRTAAGSVLLPDSTNLLVYSRETSLSLAHLGADLRISLLLLATCSCFSSFYYACPVTVIFVLNLKYCKVKEIKARTQNNGIYFTTPSVQVNSF